MVKNLPANAEDAYLIPGLGRSPGGEKGLGLGSVVLVGLQGSFSTQGSLMPGPGQGSLPSVAGCLVVSVDLWSSLESRRGSIARKTSFAVGEEVQKTDSSAFNPQVIFHTFSYSPLTSSGSIYRIHSEFDHPSKQQSELPSIKTYHCWDFPGGPVVKSPTSNTGDMGSIPSGGTKVLHSVGNY